MNRLLLILSRFENIFSPGPGHALLRAAAAWVILAWSPGMAQETGSEPLVLERTGVSFVGGTRTEVPYPCATPESETCEQPGTVRLGHAPVYYMVPADRAHELPVVMVPGLGLPAAIYLGNPNGRPGWAQYLVRQGRAVYVTPQSNVAAAGLNVSPFNAVKLGQSDPSDLPHLLTWTPEAFWRLFGYGPQYPDLWPDTRFSIEHLDGLLGGISPADLSLNAVTPRAETVVALLDEIGPAQLITHSGSGPSGFEAARLRPALVTGIASIEPVGCPTDETDIGENFLATPVLTVFGDHLDSRPAWIERANGCAEMAN